LNICGIVCALFGEVHEGNDVSGIGNGTGTIGNPDFHFSDIDGGRNDGSIGKGIIEVIVEILGKEIMFIGFILIALDREVSSLRSTGDIDGRALTFLLGIKGSNGKCTKLQNSF
jgi:hypothetical protein